MNSKKLLKKTVGSRKGIALLFAFLFIAFIAGVQLKTVPFLIITALVIITYVVDFFLSKFPIVGNVGAGLINFFIVLIGLPFPSNLLMGVVMAYFSLKPDSMGIAVPMGQMILLGTWFVSQAI